MNTRRNILATILGAITVPLWLRKAAFAMSSFPEPTDVVDLNSLNVWIAKWPNERFTSKGAVEITPAGKKVHHIGVGCAVVFDFTPAELELVLAKNLVDRRAPERRATLALCVNLQAARRTLYEAVAQRTYEEAVDNSPVYWREEPEEEVAVLFDFAPDPNGPDLDFTTDQKGYRTNYKGILKFWMRLSFDKPAYYESGAPVGLNRIGQIYPLSGRPLAS